LSDFMHLAVSERDRRHGLDGCSGGAAGAAAAFRAAALARRASRLASRDAVASARQRACASRFGLQVAYAQCQTGYGHVAPGSSTHGHSHSLVPSSSQRLLCSFDRRLQPRHSCRSQYFPSQSIGGQVQRQRRIASKILTAAGEITGSGERVTGVRRVPGMANLSRLFVRYGKPARAEL
jgi:hypothetical protein